MRETPFTFEAPGPNSRVAPDPQLFAELWTSLASLLRSYTAAHGLHLKREADVSLTEEKITVSHGEKWLRLVRSHAILTWTRENGNIGTMELTESGNLRSDTHEEAMDLAAEQWAREIMG
ncbi:MAG: transcriptional regulator [Terracidiphilus sp.]